MVEQQAKAARIRNFRDLVAWQKAMLLAREVYQTTRGFPKEEVYGLTSQMRRAAVSIASNIAEGQSRQSRGEFLRSIGHARGSLAELETQSILAADLGFLDTHSQEPLNDLICEVGRLLNGLRSSLMSKSNEN